MKQVIGQLFELAAPAGATYAADKAKRDLLERDVSSKSDALKKFQRGSTGLVPDEVRVTPKYQKAKAAYDMAFKALQVFNQAYVKKWKKEIMDERSSRVGQTRAVEPTLNRRIQQLEKLLLKHRDAYYKGAPLIDDDEYDKLEEELRKLDPDNSTLNAVGAVKFSKEEVELPVQMPSLSKIRGEAADKWVAANPGPYVITDKLDGVSIELDYKPGQPARAYTRGDSGVTGRDISYLVPHMNIPQSMRKALTVRGEMIISKAAFRKHSEEYKNARNLVAGISNKKSLHKAVKDIDVVIYAVLAPRAIPSKALANLEAMGFKTVGHKVVEGRLTSATLSKFLIARKKNSPYEIDGLVIEVDKKTPAPTSNPKHQVAFKQNLESDMVDVEVKDVTWETSRYGKMTPRIWFDPVRLSGADVQRCTAHNGKAILDNKIGKGAVIRVSRSGEVIPYWVETIKPAKKWSPPPGKEGVDWQWNDSGVDIFQTEAHSDQDTSKVRALTHFFSTLEVDGMKQGTVQRLYDAGFDDVKKILTAKPKQWVELLGPKVSQTLFVNLKSVFVDSALWLPDVMYATGIFGRGVGSKTLWKLWEKFGNDLATRKLTLAQMRTALSGDVAVTAIAQKLPEFQAWLKQFPKWEWAEPEEAEVTSTKLKGVVVCVTGFRDAALAEDIVSNSGEVVDGVGKTTTHLLVKDPATTSSKATKAHAMGIPVMTPAEFRKKFRI